MAVERKAVGRFCRSNISRCSCHTGFTPVLRHAMDSAIKTVGCKAVGRKTVGCKTASGCHTGFTPVLRHAVYSVVQAVGRKAVGCEVVRHQTVGRKMIKRKAVGVSL